jgi:serine/threonine protein kinase
MALSEIAQFIQSRVEVKMRTAHSVIYAYRDEPNVVLKAESIWIDGVPYGKSPFAEDTSNLLRREHEIYQALGDDNPYITRCLGLLEDDKGDAIALRLELASKGNLRHFIRDSPETPSMRRRLEMAAAFADCVVYLHSRKVIWGDLSTRNALVFEDDSFKICDFADAALEDRYPEFGPHTYEPRYCPPLPYKEVEEMSMLQRELFALGSAVYEITEWKMPYSHVGEDEHIWDYVEKGNKPAIAEDNVARDIIRRCWDFGYDSAKDVSMDLAALCSTVAEI